MARTKKMSRKKKESSEGGESSLSRSALIEMLKVQKTAPSDGDSGPVASTSGHAEQVAKAKKAAKKKKPSKGDSKPLGATAASAAQDEPLDKKAKKPKKTASVVVAQAEPLDKKAKKPKKDSAVAKKMKKVSANEGSEALSFGIAPAGAVKRAAKIKGSKRSSVTVVPSASSNDSISTSSVTTTTIAAVAKPKAPKKTKKSTVADILRSQIAINKKLIAQLRASNSGGKKTVKPGKRRVTGLKTGKQNKLRLKGAKGFGASRNRLSAGGDFKVMPISGAVTSSGGRKAGTKSAADEENDGKNPPNADSAAVSPRSKRLCSSAKKYTPTSKKESAKKRKSANEGGGNSSGKKRKIDCPIKSILDSRFSPQDKDAKLVDFLVVWDNEQQTVEWVSEKKIKKNDAIFKQFNHHMVKYQVWLRHRQSITAKKERVGMLRNESGIARDQLNSASVHLTHFGGGKFAPKVKDLGDHLKALKGRDEGSLKGQTKEKLWPMLIFACQELAEWLMAKPEDEKGQKATEQWENGGDGKYGVNDYLVMIDYLLEKINKKCSVAK